MSTVRKITLRAAFFVSTNTFEALFNKNARPLTSPPGKVLRTFASKGSDESLLIEPFFGVGPQGLEKQIRIVSLTYKKQQPCRVTIFPWLPLLWASTSRSFPFNTNQKGGPQSFEKLPFLNQHSQEASTPPLYPFPALGQIGGKLPESLAEVSGSLREASGKRGGIGDETRVVPPSPPFFPKLPQGFRKLPKGFRKLLQGFRKLPEALQKTYGLLKLRGSGREGQETGKEGVRGGRA